MQNCGSHIQLLQVNFGWLCLFVMLSGKALAVLLWLSRQGLLLAPGDAGSIGK